MRHTWNKCWSSHLSTSVHAARLQMLTQCSMCRSSSALHCQNLSRVLRRQCAHLKASGARHHALIHVNAAGRKGDSASRWHPPRLAKAQRARHRVKGEVAGGMAIVDDAPVAKQGGSVSCMAPEHSGYSGLPF